MIKIDFQEPDTDNWKAWRAQCEQEQKVHNAAIEAHQEHEVKKDVYDGKQFNIKSDVYKKAFSGKCAYCESKVTLDQDAEMDHFRPKNAVSDISFSPVRIEVNGEMEDHPGYYWLCYDYKNLLLSCTLCNQKRVHKDKPPTGKGTRFPVRGQHAAHPGEEENESPLLVNPVFENPEEHLRIDETGTFSARTDRGQACMDVFGLNLREDLVDARKKAFVGTKAKFRAWWAAVHFSPEEAETFYRELMDVKEGKDAYSAAGRLALKTISDGNNVAEKLQRLRN